MFKFFRKTKTHSTLPFLVDMHSHLLPGLDDGVKSIEESIYILKILQNLGYKKIITTPHIMSDQYPNSEEDILMKTSELNRILEKQDISIVLESAAEYYLDEQLTTRLAEGEKLLTFHSNHLLFETSFINKPAFLEEAIFNMNSNGYQPVLAHPERYVYLQSNSKLIEQLKNMNVLFQLNIMSLFGYYSPEVKRNAIKLIKSNVIDFVGTDCHNALQADEIQKHVNKKRNRILHSLQVRNQSML